ncbi:dihydroorotase [Chloroflexota bacterium]
MTKRYQNKNRDLLIRGGRIIDPSQGIDAVGDLLIVEGKIRSVNAQQTDLSSQHYDSLPAQGMIVCPGFVDLHCHLRQPGFEDKETIATGTRSAARGGFTTVCCMPNTKPPIDTKSIVDYIKNTAIREGVVRVLPIGCITRERKGIELAALGELAASGVIAFSDDGQTVADSNIMSRALEYSRALGLPISEHCEDLSLTRGGVMNKGSIAIKLGLTGIPPAAEERIVARDIALAKSTNGRLHVTHISTTKSVDLIRNAKKEGVAITAEVTPHHLTLTEEMVLDYNTNAKVNPPLRKTKDVDALIGGLKEGVIDAIVTDHAPHTMKDKQCGFNIATFGISGFETALGNLLSLVRKEKLDLITLISKLTIEPAMIIKDSTAGTLKPGVPADVVVFDPRSKWVVHPEEFASKGKNTPLAGRTLKGRVKATLVGGNIVYRDESIVMQTIDKSTGASVG